MSFPQQQRLTSQADFGATLTLCPHEGNVGGEGVVARGPVGSVGAVGEPVVPEGAAAVAKEVEEGGYFEHGAGVAEVGATFSFHG